MAENLLMLRGRGNVDVQIGGPGYNWIYLSTCASMSGPTVPKGATEIRWCQDPQRADGFKISSQFRTAPDQISFDLMTKLGKINYLEDLECMFAQRARYAFCGEREDPSNYDPIMLTYSPAEIQEWSYEDLVVTDPANEDEILITAPVQAMYEYRVRKINPSRIGSVAELGDQPINDVEYCGSPQCAGYCGPRSDGCTEAWAVTDADVTPYAAPNLIKITKDWLTDAMSYEVNPILGFNNNVENIECAGSRLVVAGNGDSAVGYNDHDGDPDEWNLIPLDYAPAANHNALFALNARILWLGAEQGRIYKSINGGLTWTEMHAGQETNETINAVHAHDKDLVYAVGNNGVILKSTNGGQTWTDLTEVATTAANLLVVRVPPNRSNEAYIGTNDGMIYRSRDEGVNFGTVTYTFPGDGVGTVDDIDFVGPHAGEVMFFLHNDAGPRGRVMRDLSGGAGGADVEEVLSYTEIVETGIELNAITPCNVNEVLTGGELFGGYPILIKIN